MTTCTESSQEQILRELQCKVDVKTDQVRKLEEVLLTYNKTKENRDSLKMQLDEMKSWYEDRVKTANKMKMESKDDCEKQKEVLKNAECDEIKLQEEEKKLIDLSKFMDEQWKLLMSTKHKLCNEVDKLEFEKNCYVSEFSSVKLDVENKSREVERTRRTLRCKEEELSVGRKRLDECLATLDGLKDAVAALERELNGRAAELAAAEACLSRCDETRRAEKEDLRRKTDGRSGQLRDAGAQLDAVRRTTADRAAETGRLERLAAESRREADRARADLEPRAQALRREWSGKDAALRRAVERLARVRRDNESAAAELERLRARLRDAERRSDEARREADELKKSAENRLSRLDRVKAALAGDVRAAGQRIADARLEADRLRRENPRRAPRDGADAERVCCDPASASAAACLTKELRAARDQNEYWALCDDIERLKCHARSLLTREQRDGPPAVHTDAR